MIPDANRAGIGTGSAVPAERRRNIVAAALALVLMSHQLPLQPFIALVFHPGVEHAPCTHEICRCTAKCTCNHHTSGHGATHHGDDRKDARPSWDACGGSDTSVLFTPTTLDKALVSDTDVPRPHIRPPLALVAAGTDAPFELLYDVFHPPQRI